MGRRKKRNNFKFILIVLVVVVGAWIVTDFWFNVYRVSQKEVAVKDVSVETGAKNEKSATTSEEIVSVLENGFKNEIYKDDRYGIEFQYPVFGGNDVRCPKFEKTDDGFSLGNFSFVVSGNFGTLDDFIASELQGMEIDKQENITVAGQTAVKVDYQTGGMGWYGSAVFAERNGKVFEFGLLANESSAKCGGIDDYQDRVYQSVILTLKFIDNF